jgi:4-amino-4-deoxy-L-arabinose transferase-like glycosyltransferase
MTGEPRSAAGAAQEPETQLAVEERAKIPMKETASKSFRLALLLLVIWLAARLAFTTQVFREPGLVQLIDRNTYVELAESLLERGTYQGYTDPRMDLVRTPAYPVFLAAVLGLSGRNLAFVAVAQLILTCATCWLVYQSAKLVANRGAALAAAWLYALSPNGLFVSLMALTETLFALVLALALYLLLRYRQEPRWRWLAACALVLGAGNLVRPIALVLILIWMLLILLVQVPEGWRARLGRAAAFGLLAWLVFLPWQIRNYAAHGEFTLSPVTGTTLRSWIVAEGLAEARGITRNQAAAEIANAESPYAYSLQVVLQYPRAMAWASLRGIFRTATGFEYSTWTNLLGVDHRPGVPFVDAALGRNFQRAWREGVELFRNGYYPQLGLSLWALGYNVILYGLPIIGALVLLWRRRDYWIVGWLAVVILYLLLSPLGAGQARFRVPAEPVLAILGGAGLAGFSLGKRGS